MSQYNPSTDSSDEVNRADRFAGSTTRQYGVVDDALPEEDVYRHDENPVQISQFRDDGPYWLHIGSRVGLHSTIMFDTVEWNAGEHQGTLWFKLTVDHKEVTTGNLDWHAAFPTRELGLVGEWFMERIDLSDYRTDVECPECGGTVLHLPMSSACEEIECDFYAEGHLVKEGEVGGSE